MSSFLVNCIMYFSSDESEYSESGGPYTEKNPLDSGWEYAIFLSYVKSVEEDDYLESVVKCFQC